DEKSDSIPALIDSHCHLNYKPLADEIDLIIERAKKAGVGAALTIGTTLSEFPQVAMLAERSENLWCTVGVHPHEASREPVTAGALQQRADHPRVVGIGETGLDYHYDHSPRPAQRTAFQSHIAAAAASGLPLIVHTREAE